MKSVFVHKCINETLQGLRDGLTLFSGPSNAAVIYNLPADNQLYVYDPHSLLRGHELFLRNFYIDEKNRCTFPKFKGKSGKYSNIKTAPDCKIDGLLSYGGCSVTVPYQMWFTEHHPDMASTGPTERWLEHAVLRFSHDIANEMELYTGISGSFLKEYSTYAIHDHIQKEILHLTSKEFKLDLYGILDAILEISKTREEGAWPYGELVFVEPKLIKSVNFLASFVSSELPQLSHAKHVRKLLLTVQGTNHKLISDGFNIFGISCADLPGIHLIADYRGRYGYLNINGDHICSFADGRYRSSSFKAKLYEVEEALLDYDLRVETRDNLFHIISSLVHHAQSMKHGCTFILDLNEVPAKISGQLLQKPLDLKNPELLELAGALSRVDGALHICRDQKLHSFACLLDGHTIEGEDRARGARYNSALRFTSENLNTIVVVVSSDRPVSVIHHGIVYHGQCQYHSKVNCTLAPETLLDWLAITE